MSERKHAILSASSSKRWMSCTPSAQLEETFQESRSEYADEGTFAHALGELLLRKALGLIPKKKYNDEMNAAMSHQLYSQSLVDYVQNYVDLVMEKVAAAKKTCSDAVVLLEQKLDFSQWVPEGFGTGDVVIIADGILEIVDLKYGKGVPVFAQGNPQLRLYGLGALNQYDGLYDVDMVRMTIIQPRLDSISSEEISASGLYKWADEEVKPKAALAMAGEGEFVAGDHCKFCRAKAICRKRAEANLELAKFDFMEPAILSDDEIAEILKKAEQLQAWANDVQAYALDQAENHGKKWPGWKLVEGRSNRMYSDKDAVASKLKEEGYADSVIFKPKELKGITDMEKAIGKKIFEEYLNGLVIKPAGKPTLVPETDKRPEINSAKSAAADFAEEDPLS